MHTVSYPVELVDSNTKNGSSNEKERLNNSVNVNSEQIHKSIIDEDELEDEEIDDEDEVESGSTNDDGIGDASPDDAREIEKTEPDNELNVIKMSLLMKALNVRPCDCSDCEMAQKMQNLLNGEKIMASNETQNNLSNGFRIGIDAKSSEHYKVRKQEASEFQMSHQSSFIFGQSTSRGRRSKYCTPSEKKAVAGYVQIHGATAAAKKFNIPPAVAAYYHRREFKNKQTGKISNNFIQTTANIIQQCTKDQDVSAEGERLMDGVNQEEYKTTNQQLAQILQNASASGGAHAFLRGRGRGRPKLIGDELDAELVEHIVKLKQTNPNAHLTASQALIIARSYIAEKAPGLLEEHGGQVKLKITWAMKLVTRVQEREREIQLGLPPGTLQNLPRSMVSSDQNISNFDELVGKNFIGQQINNVNAILAAATGSGEKTQREDSNNSTTDAAMLNAVLGMATGNADYFNLMDQQPGTSGTRQNSNNEIDAEQQDEAIRQLLASLQGGRTDQMEQGTEIDSTLCQMIG